ncbi:MAG: hypothetical protein FJY55_09590 [Betaproteobacteria bacterium]|nr:hypothetical protein [Betaproteobacteria bacterium]
MDLPDPRARPETQATIAPLLYCDDDQKVFLNGRIDTLECFASFRTRLQESRRTWDLPVPLRAEEPQSLRHATWRSDIVFRWAHGADRPAHWAEDWGDLAEPGGPAYNFLLAVLARMQDFEAALSDSKDPWDSVLERWIDPKVDRDPTMDILVRHAQEHRVRWVDIAEHPRRVLNRQRELVPLSRAQDLDTKCMQWLGRQPGETLAERAGGRQRVLALARFENRNTLENRVFRDLLERTVGAAREYLLLNAGRESGTSRRVTRYSLVQQYARECRRLSLELAEQGVTRATEVVQPNYVLLHDDRYRHVWTAWQEIIRRERAMDDLWRWQRRSWAEFCEATLVMSLLAAQSRPRLVAASPIFIRSEQRRGEWLLHDDPLAVITHEEKGWVVEVLGGNSHDVPDKMKEFGASVWLRVSDHAGGEYKYLPVWTVHCLRPDISLADLVESANEAYRMLRDKAMLVGAVVLQSMLDPHAPMTMLHAEHVTGFAFGPWDAQLPDALGSIGDDLSGRIEAAS